MATRKLAVRLLVPIAVTSIIGALTVPSSAYAASVEGYQICVAPRTTWGTGGTNSGYLYVSAGAKHFATSHPYYFTIKVDSGKSSYPVAWSASGPSLQYGKSFCG